MPRCPHSGWYSMPLVDGVLKARAGRFLHCSSPDGVGLTMGENTRPLAIRHFLPMHLHCEVDVLLEPPKPQNKGQK
eukprot:3032383-Amphidinium_carterae.1